jgi:Putative Actinobacterial Holin-X, holin superfamily III
VAQKSASQQVQEVRELLIAYVRQETLEPITKLKKYVGLSVGGALLMGTGVIFIAIGVLRLLQGTEWWGTQWKSVAAYAVVAVSLLVSAGLTIGVFRPRETRRLNRGAK